MEENSSNATTNSIENSSVKNITNVFKKITTEGITENCVDSICDDTQKEWNSNTNSTCGDTGEEWKGNSTSSNSTETGSTFKVVGTNLPEKTSFWTKMKNALCYEIKVELTPKQQKVEDEINEFLHQEITWQSFKNFLFQEVAITYKGKRIF